MTRDHFTFALTLNLRPSFLCDPFLSGSWTNICMNFWSLPTRHITILSQRPWNGNIVTGYLVNSTNYDVPPIWSTLWRHVTPKTCNTPRLIGELWAFDRQQCRSNGHNSNTTDTPVQHDRNIWCHKCYRVSVARHLQTHRCNVTATFGATSATASLSHATCRHTGATRLQHLVPQVLPRLCRTPLADTTVQHDCNIWCHKCYRVSVARHLRTHRCNVTATFGAISATASLSTPLEEMKPWRPMTKQRLA